MKTAKLKSFFKKFQKEREEDCSSLDEEIIERIFKKTTYHPDDKSLCENYVFSQLNRLKRFNERQKETIQKPPEKQELSENYEQKQALLAGAREKELGDKIREAILNGDISKENLKNQKYKFEGQDPRKFGFGPIK